MGKAKDRRITKSFETMLFNIENLIKKALTQTEQLNVGESNVFSHRITPLPEMDLI